MAVYPVTHAQWQVLRAVKRSRRPAVGRSLRLVPNRSTRAGSFLTVLVRVGLLRRSTGTEAAPFDATYQLTDLGEHAAEYGEAEFDPEVAHPTEPPALRRAR